MHGEHDPNSFTPEEIDEHLRDRTAGDVSEEELPTGERDVDDKIATGDVGDNERESEE